MTARTQRILLLFLLFAALFALRGIHLDADPPHDLSSSMGYLSDPGGYVFNARNKLVFGRWEMDMWNIMYISPLPHYLTYVIFLTWGIGIAQMNLVPVLFSCLLLIIFYLILRGQYPVSLAALGTVLLGINFQFTMFSRIAVRAMPMLFFVILAFYLLMRPRRRMLMVFLAGICCFLAFTVKATFVAILPSFLAGLFFHTLFSCKAGFRKALGSLGFFGLGLATVASGWLLLFYFPHRQMFLDYGGKNIDWLTPDHLWGVLKNFWIRPLFFFNTMPVMTILASLFLLILAFRALTAPKKLSLLQWICGFWMMSHVIYYSVIYYNAARHFVALVIPIVILGFDLLAEIFQGKTLTEPEKIPLRFYPFLFFWLLFPLSSAVILVSRPRTYPIMLSRFLLICGISLGLCLFMGVLGRLRKKTAGFRMSRPLGSGLLASLVVISAFTQLKPYSDWAAAPRHTIKTISQDLGRLADRMSLAGLMSPILTLENCHEAHVYRSGYQNPYPDFFERFKITHIFVTLHAGAIEKKQYHKDFPEVMSKVRLLARYPIWLSHAELYAVSDTPAAGEANLFEGEVFFGENGLPRLDEEASARMAFLTEGSRRGSSLLLPDLAFARGDYRAAVRIKGEELSPGDGELLNIEIVDLGRRRILGSRRLGIQELKTAGGYQEFDFGFSVVRSGEHAIRIQSPRSIRIWVDKVTVTPLPKDTGGSF